MTDSNPVTSTPRLNRLSYIGWNVLLCLGIAVVLFIILIFLPNTLNFIQNNAENLATQILLYIFNLIFLIPVMIISAKRLHDFNVSGWFALLELVPIVNIIFPIALMFIPGSKGNNKFGEPRESKTWEVVLAFIFAAIALFILVNLLFALKYFL